MSESWGMKISLPGVDVTKATPEQCSVHSKYDTHKINDHSSPAHYGVLTVTFAHDPAAGVTTNVLSFPHGYTHRPAVIGHFYDPAQSPSYAVGGQYQITVPSYFLVYATDTDFKIDFVQGNFAPPTLIGRVVTIRYYIFAEDGS